jgi:hypothetical protein
MCTPIRAPSQLLHWEFASANQEHKVPATPQPATPQLWSQTRLKRVLPNNRFERDAAKSAAPLKRNVRCQKEEGNIAQDYGGQKVADILKRKKASIKQARLPQGSPAWDAFMEMTWEQIEAGARANRPGFKVVRKLLTDKRFDK